MGHARAMWTLFEPVHAVTYFHPGSLEHLASAGVRGFWRGYFASRTAPLGPVGPAPVVATFYNFSPTMVRRALPAVWTMTTPEAVLRARTDGAVIALKDLLPEVPVEHIDEAAGLLEAAVARLDPAGRVLGAANADLPAQAEPYARLFQAATTLREHRGDGHVAALVAADIGPLEVLALRCAMGHLSWAVMQPARGWTDEELEATQVRLRERGFLGADAATATPDGAAAFAEAEAATDRAAEAPWTALGPDAVGRVRELLEPVAAVCRRVAPSFNPVGLPAQPAS